MDFHLEMINWIGVVVSGVVSVIIGGIYYGPAVMGKVWMVETGFVEEDAADPKFAIGTTFIANMIFAIGLSLVIGLAGIAPGDWLSGAHMGLAVAILLVGAGTWQNYAFENKSFKHFAIHSGNQIITMTSMGTILVLV